MSAQLNFQSAAFVNLAFVFLGAFFGSLACLLCGKIFHKKYFRFRLSLCFLLLAAAISFAVLFVVREKTESRAAFLSCINSSAVFCAVYFFVGFFCAASIKVFLPIAALLYIGWTLSFGIFLYKKMPLPQKYTVTASESFVRDEESGREWKFEPAGEGALVDFSVYELDKNALFPLPHYWHAISGARPASSNHVDEPQGQAPDVLRAACDAEIEQSSGVKKFYARLMSSAARKFLKNPRVRSIHIPKQQVYPSIFELKVNSSSEGFSVSLEKIM